MRVPARARCEWLVFFWPNNMLENQEPGKDGQLRNALREWVVDTKLPPRFQEEVWRRISREKDLRPPSFRRVVIRWIEAIFSRPALAGSYVAVLLVAAVTAGFWQGHGTRASEWRVRYVQSVDPYQMHRN